MCPACSNADLSVLDAKEGVEQGRGCGRPCFMEMALAKGSRMDPRARRSRQTAVPERSCGG